MIADAIVQEETLDIESTTSKDIFEWVAAYRAAMPQAKPRKGSKNARRGRPRPAATASSASAEARAPPPGEYRPLKKTAKPAPVKKPAGT